MYRRMHWLGSVLGRCISDRSYIQPISVKMDSNMIVKRTSVKEHVRMDTRGVRIDACKSVQRTSGGEMNLLVYAASLRDIPGIVRRWTVMWMRLRLVSCAILSVWILTRNHR